METNGYEKRICFTPWAHCSILHQLKAYTDTHSISMEHFSLFCGYLLTLSIVHTKKKSENGYRAEYGHLKAFSATYLQQISVLSHNIMEKECK